MELYIWDSPFQGIISIDYHCITAAAYLRALNVNFNLVKCTTPGLSPTGKLPVLKNENEWIGGLEHIIRYLSKKGYDLDEKLNKVEKAKSTAYISMILDKLYDLTLYYHYVDRQNYIKTIRPSWSKLLSFPFNYITPHSNHKAALARLSTYGVSSVEMKTGFVIEDEQKKMLDMMIEILDTLTTRMNDNKYIFGSISTVDIVFLPFYLLLFKSNLPNDEFNNVLAKYPKIMDYADRVNKELDLGSIKCLNPPPQSFFALTEYLSNEFVIKPTQNLLGKTRSSQSSSSISLEHNSSQTAKSPEDVDFDRKRIWAITGGIAAMAAYIIINGIIQVEFDEDDSTI